jgi:hypothetical protein
MSEEWNGEDWEDFHSAADSIAAKLGISVGSAQAKLRHLCAIGEVRSIEVEDANEPLEAPEPIPPSQWRTEDVDFREPTLIGDRMASGLADVRLTLILVSEDDIWHWLDQQQPVLRRLAAEPPALGKRPRIKDHLKNLYPEGVPDPSHCPRKELQRQLLKLDPKLAPLDDGTLKLAVDEYNLTIRSDPN